LIAAIFFVADILPLIPRPPKTDFVGITLDIMLAYPQTAIDTVSGASGLVGILTAGLVVIVMALLFLVGIWIGLFVWPELLVLRILI
jgi:hypothetical protein